MSEGEVELGLMEVAEIQNTELLNTVIITGIPATLNTSTVSKEVSRATTCTQLSGRSNVSRFNILSCQESSSPWVSFLCRSVGS